MKGLKYQTPEDEFNAIIDCIEFRAMATDGPVTPTLREATEKELSRLWELVNEISPKRKALARKMLKVETTSDDEVKEYLRSEGLDPDQVAREGSTFVRVLQEKIALEKLLIETAVRCNLILPTTEEQIKWFEDGTPTIKSGDFFERIHKACKTGW